MYVIIVNKPSNLLYSPTSDLPIFVEFIVLRMASKPKAKIHKSCLSNLSFFPLTIIVTNKIYPHIINNSILKPFEINKLLGVINTGTINNTILSTIVTILFFMF